MLHVALVGAGGMAKNYRKAYTTIPGVEFTVAVDVDPAQLEACKALGVKRTGSEFEMALSPEIDVVDVSTPNHLHEEQAIAALKAGKHVLLQKPIANSLESADRILAAAKKSKGVLGMYMSSYSMPIMWEIKRMYDGGHLGKIQSVRARDSHRGGLRAKPGDDRNWRGNKEMVGGGAMVQLSIHPINLTQWWLGSDIVEVAAFSDNRQCPNIGGDDVTVAVAKYANGVYGTFDCGYASEGVTREMYGTKGYARLWRRNMEFELELQLDEAYSSAMIKYTTPGQIVNLTFAPAKLDDTNQAGNQQRMFIEAIREGRKPHMPGEIGRRDLGIVYAAYRSAESGRIEKCS
jgi:predicted dehydrogenase